MEHSWGPNEFVGQVASTLHLNPRRLVWAGDYADPEPDGKNVYDIDGVPHAPAVELVNPRYLCNVTKSEYVDLANCPAALYGWSGDGAAEAIHPLPLLTCEGNGRGGGDYSGTGMEFVGRWARDVIYTTQLGTTAALFTQIRPNFVEDGSLMVFPLDNVAEFYGGKVVRPATTATS